MRHSGSRGNAILSRYPIESRSIKSFASQEAEGGGEKRNVTSNTYATVTNNFRDVWALALPPRDLDDPSAYTNPTGGAYPPPSKRIDYIFLRKESRLNLVAVSVLNTVNLSDHFPVFARISFD